MTNTLRLPTNTFPKLNRSTLREGYDWEINILTNDPSCYTWGYASRTVIIQHIANGAKWMDEKEEIFIISAFNLGALVTFVFTNCRDANAFLNKLETASPSHQLLRDEF